MIWFILGCVMVGLGILVLACVMAGAGDIPSPPRPNGGTPPQEGENLDAPTLTRRDIKRIREEGAEVVHPAVFREL